MSVPALDVVDVTVRYGDVLALDRANVRLGAALMADPASPSNSRRCIRAMPGRRRSG